LVWYDLGPRKGPPARALWIYDEGEIDHAILALTVDQNDLITNLRVDRMPAQHEQMEFDVEKWKRHESRIKMVRSIPKHLGKIEYRPLTEIKKVLSEPSGRTVLRNSPWELVIPQKALNWDVFFYWPTEDYPPRAYGGRVERIGRWAYVHE
jgi:hypothetical protein